MPEQHVQAPDPQTVRLKRGQHQSPDHGLCVMELASLLEGGPFTDEPESVSPLVGTFLREYNDRLDPSHRGDLVALAEASLDSKGTEADESRRAELCRAWVRRWHPRLERRWWELFPQPLRVRHIDVTDRVAALVAGQLAALLVRRGDEEAHASALQLAHELIEGRTDPPS